MSYELPEDTINKLLDDTADKSADQKPKKKKKGGRPRKANIVRGVSVQENLPPDYRRATLILKVDNFAWLKDYSRKNGETLKDTANRIIEEYKERVEKQEQKARDKEIETYKKQGVKEYLAQQKEGKE